jgi:threonyl-tRNA synthetase
MHVTETLLRSGYNTVVGLERVSDFVKNMKHKYCTENLAKTK